jgi:hypothetical protein
MQIGSLIVKKLGRACYGLGMARHTLRGTSIQLNEFVDSVRNSYVHGMAGEAGPHIARLNEDRYLVAGVVEHPWLAGLEATFIDDVAYVQSVIVQPLVPVAMEHLNMPVPEIQTFVSSAIDALRQYIKKQKLVEDNLQQIDDRVVNLLSSWASRKRHRDLPEYAALAARYAKEIQKGNTAPVRKLSDELGISSVTTAQRIREAREKRLLTVPVAGNTGGELTPLALAYLQPDFPGIRALRERGLTLEEIEREYGITREQATKTLVDAGLPHLAFSQKVDG